jgi:GAF domain-containing protein
LVTCRKTSVDDSICQYTVRLQHPLSIQNARVHPLVMEHPSVAEMGVMAYLGFPLFDPAGFVLGTLCFVDVQPREWDEEEKLAAIKLAIEVSKSLDEALAAFRSLMPD